MEYIPKLNEEGYYNCSLNSGFSIEYNKEGKHKGWNILAEDCYYSANLQIHTEEDFKKFISYFN